MQNNSNNNTRNWRQRLDELEDTPGNNLDLNRAWEKLEQKKNETNLSSSKKWYWLAAACLTVLLSFVLMFTKHPTSPENISVLKNTDPVIEKEQNNFVIQNSPEIISVKETKNTIQEKNKPAAVLQTAKSNIQEPLLMVQKTDPVANIVLPADSIIQQSLPSIASTKKMKLVHINELNESPQGMAKEEGKPYFPIAYPTKEVYTDAGNNDKKGKDNLLRIKIN